MAEEERKIDEREAKGGNPVRTKPRKDQGRRGRPTRTSRKRPTWKQKILLVAMGLAVLLLAEAALRVAGYGGTERNDPMAGFAGLQLFEEIRNEDGCDVYRTSPAFSQSFNEQEFPAAKGEGTFRIFCFGGSSAFGFPQGAEIAFPRWLKDRLEVRDPSRQWEVLNLGGVSYASHRLRLLMHEVVRYEPDLFVVYSGHNEFVEKNFYENVLDADSTTVKLDVTLARWSRLYSLMRTCIRNLRDRAGGTPEPGEGDMVFDVVVRRRTVRMNPEILAETLQNYLDNLKAMVGLSRANGVPIVLLTTPPNLRDWAPDGSAHRDGLSSDELRSFDQLMASGMQALDTGDAQMAAEHFRQTLAIDEEYAEAWYRLGQAAQRVPDEETARDAYSRARDSDVLPIRALAAMEQTVTDLGGETDTPVIDIARAFRAESQDGQIGREMVMDYVHPTIRGHQVIAAEIEKWMLDAEYIPEPAEERAAIELRITQAQEAAKRKLESQMTESPTELLNEAYALRNQGKYDEAIAKARQAAAAKPMWATARNALATLYYDKGMVAEAEAEFRAGINIDPLDDRSLTGLGSLLLRTGRHAQAEVFLRRACEARPESATAASNLGKLLGMTGRLEESKAVLEQAIALDPKQTGARTDLGVVLSRLGDVEGAMEQYRQVVTLEPTHAIAHYNLASNLVALNQIEEAIMHYQAAVESGGAPPGVLIELGRVLISDRRYLEASITLEKAVARNPDSPDAINALAWLLATCPQAEVRDGAMAVELAQRLCNIVGRDNPAALDTLAVAYAEAGRFQDAAGLVDRAIELARAAGMDPLAAEIDRHAALIHRRQPYHEP